MPQIKLRGSGKLPRSDRIHNLSSLKDITTE